MAHLHDEAVCLRQWDWSETSQTAALFTREHGLIRALAKGSRRPKSAYSGGLEPLTRGALTAVTRKPPALTLLTSWDLLEPYPRIRRDLPAFAAACHLADITAEMLQLDDPHPELYTDLVEALGRLGSGSGDPAAAALTYQWRLVVATGHQPELDLDPRTGDPIPDSEVVGFSPETGGIRTDPGSKLSIDPLRTEPPAVGPWRLRRQTRQTLRDLSAVKPMNPGPEQARSASRFLAAWIAWRLGRKPRSLVFYIRSIDESIPKGSGFNDSGASVLLEGDQPPRRE